MTTPKISKEEEFVRCFVSFILSKVEGAWDSTNASFAEVVLKNKKHKKLRLMIDFDYDNSTDSPTLNVHQKMFAIVENNYL